MLRQKYNDKNIKRNAKKDRRILLRLENEHGVKERQVVRPANQGKDYAEILVIS